MADNSNYKDVTLDREGPVKRFRIRPVSAQDGSWILAQYDSGAFTREDVYAKILAILYSRCQYFPAEVELAEPLELYNRNAQKFRLLDMETDFMAAQELFEEASDFNLGPYLRKRVIKLAKARAELEGKGDTSGTPPQNSLKDSTPTSGAQ